MSEHRQFDTSDQSSIRVDATPNKVALDSGLEKAGAIYWIEGHGQ